MIQRESNLDHDILLPLSVKKVSRSYRMKEGKRIVLDNVSFSVHLGLELSKQVQRLVMVDFPRALPTQTLTWP